MSYQEKKVVVNMLTGLIVMVSYIVYAVVRSRSGNAVPEDVRFWAGAMLLFIGIGVAAAIVTQIVFHILFAVSVAVENRQEDEKVIDRTIQATMVEDEMDRMIELKSSRTAFAATGIGFVGGLVSLLLGYPTAVMLNILFFAFLLGSLLEGGTQLYYYRKGVRNG